MYVKIINPKTNGQKVYANTGSARRATNYLEKEAKDNGQTATFFSSAERGNLTGDEVVTMLDTNQKGLGKDAAKFYSLVLSPSSQEVGELGNSPEALARYTRSVMELYAKNFQLKGGKELGEADLVWAATIHQERKNRGTDEGAQGEVKPGLQTHVHVMVSARNATQKITLNPLTTADRFNRVQFQAQAGAQLDEQLGHVGPREIGGKAPTRTQRIAEKAEDIQTRAASNREQKPLTTEQIQAKDLRLEVQVVRVNTKLTERQQLDPEQVKQSAKERGYDNVFYATLGKIERNAEKGTYTHDPYEYLRTGRVQRADTLRETFSQRPTYTEPAIPARRETSAIPAIFQAFEHSINNLSRAMAPKTRTQDVRSEEEKVRDYEQEM